MGKPRRIIGVDESGKGDFFGPLVVAAFLCDDARTDDLKALGVRDGKLIAEKKTLQIDEQLRAEYPHAIVVFPPAEYNRRYDEIRNLNKLLAEGHAEAIDQLLKTHPADQAVSDKFGKPELVEGALARRRTKLPLVQLVQGERIIQVAAASILARARFIREMNELSTKCGLDLPRGAAAHVDTAGRAVVRKHGVEMLSSLAKLHFKNYRRVVDPTLFPG